MGEVIWQANEWPLFLSAAEDLGITWVVVFVLVVVTVPRSTYPPVPIAKYQYIIAADPGAVSFLLQRALWFDYWNIV